MIFYVLLAVIALGLFVVSYRYPSAEKCISLILLGIMILIGGFRDRIGWDYDSYTNWYLKGTRDDNLEFGFLAIMKVFRYFNLDYHFLFFFISFFTYLFAYLGVKKYTQKQSLSLVLYFLIPVMFLGSFTLIRQFLSVAIAFYAFSYLLNKKYIIYFLLMVIGISIHYSCLVPFMVFLIVFKWGEFLRMRHLYFLMVVTFIIGQLGIIHLFSFFFKGTHYNFYVSSQNFVPVPFLKLLAINTMIVFVIKYFDTNGFQFSNQKYLLVLYVFCVLFLNLFSESMDLCRFYIYFRIFEIILLAEILRNAILKRRLFLIGIICCFYLFPYFRAINIDYETGPNGLTFIPYKSLLF